MNKYLQEYLDIQTTFSGSLREQRKKRHDCLCQWAMREDEPLPVAREVSAFFKEYPRLSYGVPFARKIMLPCLREEFSSGATELFSFLCANPFGEGFTAECFSSFCKQEDITLLALSEELCRRAPCDDSLRRFWFDKMTNSLSYIVHELPLGLLDDEEAPFLKELLTKWSSVAESLGLDVGAQARAFHAVDDAWKEYLQGGISGDVTRRFDEYLRQNGIEWECFFSPCFWTFREKTDALPADV